MKNTSKVYTVAALAGGSILAASSLAHAAAPACNSYSNTVFFAGSSASLPILSQLAVAIGNSVSIIYQGPSSCVGLNDVISNTQETKSAVYLDPTNAANQIACDITNGGTSTGNYIDVGVSDVYPATCTAYSNIPMLGATQKDFHGPIQAMTMAVQNASTESSISAEAAYVVFGWAGQTNTVAPWTDPTMMFIRTPTSGTESMIGWAIGILATAYVDQNRATLRALAFQAKDPHTGGDQDCGYLPDSSSTAFDKLNVRQGRYAIWGPLHFVVNTDSGGNPIANPSNTSSTNTAVARVVNFLSANNLSMSDSTALIKASQKAYTVPQCAMEVTTTSEIGAEASYQPTGACGCYFESLAQGGMTTSSYCRTCAADADCADAGVYKHCNYTYCEAQ
jgi:hypothetical protein